PQPPATGQPQQPPPPPRPGGPMMPPQMGGPRSPMMPPMQGRPPAPAAGGPDPATAMAVRGALGGGAMPSAYGQLATRAALSPLMGPGGPRLPRPGGPPNA